VTYSMLRAVSNPLIKCDFEHFSVQMSTLWTPHFKSHLFKIPTNLCVYAFISTMDQDLNPGASMNGSAFLFSDVSLAEVGCDLMLDVSGQ
jgi:hypothetical protein